MDGGDAARVRLDFAKLFLVEPFQTLETVCAAAAEKVTGAIGFEVIGGDDDFAALVVRDVMLAAEGQHLAEAGEGETRFERAGSVMQAGVEDAAIVRRLVLADVSLFFDYYDSIVAAG
jgi:hypothetical protein